jgi:hypothetical protein
MTAKLIEESDEDISQITNDLVIEEVVAIISHVVLIETVRRVIEGLVITVEGYVLGTVKHFCCCFSLCI